MDCPKIEADQIRQGGFFPLDEAFRAPKNPVSVFTLAHGQSHYLDPSSTRTDFFPGLESPHLCLWTVLLFEYADCKRCSLQWESAQAFLTQGFGSLGNLRFLTVVGQHSNQTALQNQANEGATRPQRSYLYDPEDHFFEQLAVQATPSAALIDPNGLVRGYYAGLVEFDGPGFETFSQRLSGKSENVKGTVIPLALFGLFLGLVLLLGYHLARRRPQVV